MIIFYRWHGVENTVGASSAEYTLGNASVIQVERVSLLENCLKVQKLGVSQSLLGRMRLQAKPVKK